MRAVIAESFERIHRANLIALGIVPLRFAPGQSRASLGLTGTEAFTLRGLHAGVAEGATIQAEAAAEAGAGRGAASGGAAAAVAGTTGVRVEVFADVAAPAEARLQREGGMFARVLRGFAGRLGPGASCAR
ncbi:MAG: hypothetical protein JSW68_02270 [Burkholderiales bacterium]|nr:MAG: hypothetical protein JSW68_02270 [Burkholderiales bacterium]